ncbi:hypothetical protein BD626DRAFT_635716 [Schizophyllum amplum]|uniref:AMP-dependent synthetase/ligase domain-containing protein n=1 Tax=Schizophyllum amplum TaxID=97359 RepID=A0A550BVJ0_9AGAR|nr:hypothetical protein BD626DRAFT_635716 [Auriculariopsis ampla]
MAWIPKVSVEESQRLLSAPGTLLETQIASIEGRVFRTYKNLPPSCRAFWLGAVQIYGEREYIVFEDQRYTFREAHARIVRTAAVLRDLYGIRKGNHIGLVARNFPDYIIVFWACHLIGAIPVLVNALLPRDTIKYCLLRCDCKLIVLDWERANILENDVDELVRELQVAGVVVLQSSEGKGNWKGMRSWDGLLKQYGGDSSTILRDDLQIGPEDDCIIMFTSGTTGLPKGVLSSQRAFLTNLFNNICGSRRASIRKGEVVPTGILPPPMGMLLPVPLFHITGTSVTLLATFGGAKIVLVRKYDPKQVAAIIKKEDVKAMTAVPAVISDIIDLGATELADHEFATLGMGGSPAHNLVTQRAAQNYPGVAMAQAYGLTEMNATCTSHSGEDFAARPQSCGLACPVTDILIVDDDSKALPPGHIGEIWARGPHMMKGYYGDPEATAKIFTKDGWCKTGDVGVMCAEGFLYIRDRKKDMIIRGGENIDCVSIENALHADPGVLEAAAVAVPDERLGELPAAVVSLKEDSRGKVDERSLLSRAKQTLPRFAVPVMIIVRKGELGKVVKAPLKEMAADEWKKRKTARERFEPASDL